MDRSGLVASTGYTGRSMWARRLMELSTQRLTLSSMCSQMSLSIPAASIQSTWRPNEVPARRGCHLIQEFFLSNWKHIRNLAEQHIQNLASLSAMHLKGSPLPKFKRHPPRNWECPSRSWSQTVRTSDLSMRSCRLTSSKCIVWSHLGLRVLRQIEVFCLQPRPFSGTSVLGGKNSLKEREMLQQTSVEFLWHTVKESVRRSIFLFA